MAKLRAPLRQLFDDHVPEAQVQRIWRKLQRKEPRRSSRAWLMPLMAATSLLLLGLAGWLGLRPAQAPGALAIHGAEALGPSRVLGGDVATAWPLEDGSRIQLARASRLQVLENTGHAFAARLESGRGEFEVKPGGPRRWRIDCGALSVEVVGTGFVIERNVRGVSVAVRHGVVRVRSAQIAGGVRRLAAGERLDLPAEQQLTAAASKAEQADGSAAGISGPPSVPTLAEPPASVAQAAKPPPTAAGAKSANRSVGEGAMSQRSIAPADHASASLERAASSRRSGDKAQHARGPVADASGSPPLTAATPARLDGGDVAALLRRADQARHTGHSSEAEALLERVRAGWPGSPHAALAALTLARMRIATAPERAAQDLSAALAAKLPQGLREDAMARLVEAHARAGELELARTAAQAYRRAYPHGRLAAEDRALDAASVTARRVMWRASWLAATLFSIPGYAQAPSQLSLSLHDCRSGATEPSAELLELLRLELRADAVARVTVLVERVHDLAEARTGREVRRGMQFSSQAELGTALSIERGCERTDDVLLLGYRDAARDKRLQRSLSLADVPVALRERTLALALAELFRAGQADTSAERAGEPPPMPVEAESRRQASDFARSDGHPAADGGIASALEPVERPPPVAVSEIDLARRGATTQGASSSWAFALGPGLYILPASGTSLIGAELALSWRALSVGVLGHLGDDSDQLGSLAYRRLHGFVEYDLLSMDPAPFRIAAGLRAAFGATFANVTPALGAISQNVSAGSADAALETSFAWLISSGWQTKLRLDFGYAFGPRIRADDRDLANFSGLFIGASLCMVAAFPNGR